MESANCDTLTEAISILSIKVTDTYIKEKEEYCNTYIDI